MHANEVEKYEDYFNVLKQYRRYIYKKNKYILINLIFMLVAKK